MTRKEDILKLQPLIGKLTPIQWEGIHNAMQDYAEKYHTEQLNLARVDSRRELLNDFADE